MCWFTCFGKPSSAQKVRGPGSVFDSPDEAASDLLLYAAEQSRSDPVNKILERGGDIFPVEGGHSYNDLQVGLAGEVEVKVRLDAVGWAHTDSGKLKPSRNPGKRSCWQP